MKSLVYKDSTQSLDDLRNNIIITIREITADLCEKVMENWVERIHICKSSRGGHLKDIIFHN